MKYLTPKSEFGRNVLTLMAGTIVAQSIPIAISPILTRLYEPAEFGLFGLYMGLAAILSIIVTGRYEQAIMLPASDNDAANLVTLSLIITTTISFLVFLIIFLTSKNIALALEKPDIEKWLFLLPITTFLTGTYQTFNYWNNRKKQYTTLAKNRIFQSTNMSIIHVAGGFFSSNGIFLIIGDIIGKLVSTFTLAWKTLRKTPLKSLYINRKKQISLAKRYKKFPIFDVSASLANVLSYQIQNILFPILYGLSSAGFYFLVMRVLQSPLSLIGASLVDVYKQKLTDTETTDEDLKSYYKKMFIILFLIGLPPLLIFMFFGEKLFIFIFGKQWEIAGKYAVILAPMFFIRLIAAPLSYFLYLKEKQEVNSVLQAIFILYVIIAFSISQTAFETISLISLLFSINYLFYLVYSARLAKVI